MFRYIYILLFFLCTCTLLQAQEQEPYAGFGIEMNVVAGKVLKHSKKFKAPIPPLSTGIDICFEQQTWGRKDWHQRRKYPLIGMGVNYINYGNDAVYGYEISLYPCLQIPLISGKHLEWTLRIGYGLGYLSRKYERTPVWDTLNNAIGSHINNFSIFSTDIRYHVNQHWDVQTGLQFYHTSNAAVEVPNLGVNTYGAHVGVRYSPVTSKPIFLRKNLPRLTNRWLVQSRLGIAFNQSGSYGGPIYRSYLYSLYASKRWISKNKLFFGVDYSFHEKVYYFLKINEIHPGDEYENSWKGAVFVGNEFLLGRLGILTQVGYYVHKDYLTNSQIYEKLGLNYYLLQHEQGVLKELCFSTILKVHTSVAELVEFGVGMGF
jgi:hypothetical protein